MSRGSFVKGRQLNARTFVQRGGSLPGSPINYLGNGKGQLRAGAVTLPSSGTNIIVRPSDDTYGEFQQIGMTVTPPEAGTISLTQDFNPDVISFLESVKEDGEGIGIHLLFADDKTSVGNTNGWRSKIVIPDASPNTLGLSDIQAADGDEVTTLTSEITFFAHNRALRVSWQEVLSALIATPAAGVAFGNSRKNMYLMVAGDGTTTSPKFFYSTDRGVTWTSVTVTALINTEHPVDLLYVGGYLIAPSKVGNAYVYATEDDYTTWTKITSGFVATKTPNAIYGDSLNRVFFAADGGYLYQMGLIGTNVKVLLDGTLTAQNLNAVHGKGEQVIAVGATNAVVKSTNGGESFSLMVGPEVGAALTSVQVLDTDVYVIGTGTGKLWYTLTGGKTWSELGFPGSGAGSVSALKFLPKNQAFGLLAHKPATGNAKVYRTTDAGNTWEAVTLDSFPAASDVKRFALWDPNTLMAAGVAVTTTDGMLAIAKPARSE